MVINGLVYAGQQYLPGQLLYYFALWPTASQLPQGPPFEVWQLLTYGFLHGNPTHILFNMFGLWMFGRDIERVLGAKQFAIYYLTCVAGAAVIQLIVAQVQGGIYPTVGASGGVFGLLLAYAMFFPDRTVMLLFPPIPMRAKYFVLFYGLMELYLGVSGRSPGVANFAHLGGMLFGFGLLRYWRSQRSR
ncbi:MAG: rhomboid family intramembrane serine protease [Woeseia sp.]|nr:rhomboid family intramembrane serine protease [Woeseia sp.]MBT8096149.1 rhomboid family intramembrane serine protease [Woeseia sp.]NNE62310.1 rhomboid family intramembrane serine protease [Woeseia sp.]NNL54828.1 rhomboid family intramembrane serine protease [Woeseia sp.]